MEAVTFIPDASTLVNNINSIKQWVYDGKIRVLVALSVVDHVRDQYKISTAPKEPIKEHQVRKSWGKMPRKEYPLFDINPRIAWEFITRAKSEKGEAGVMFQQVEESFTQWATDDKGIEHLPTPLPPPTSFANALARKIHTEVVPSVNGVEDVSKSKRITKLAETKGSMVNRTMPIVSSKNIPKDLLPLLSCILWRTHENQNALSDSSTYKLLSDNHDIRDISNSLGVSIVSCTELGAIMKRVAEAGDKRWDIGCLEADFPNRPQRKALLVLQSPPMSADVQVTSHIQSNGKVKPNGTVDLVSKPDEFPSLLKNGANVWIDRHETKQTPSHIRDSTPAFLPFGPSGSLPVTNVASQSFPDKPVVQAPIGTGRLKANRDASNSVTEYDPTSNTSSLLDILLQGSSPDEPNKLALETTGVQTSIPPIGERRKSPDESDIDSDEEVIVFKARRSSGRPKTPGDTTTRSRPATSHSHTLSNEGLKPAKSPIFSTLKPQSPVFTPGQAYVPSNSAPVESAVQRASAQTIQTSQVAPPSGPAQGRNNNTSPPNAQSPAHSPQRRTTTPRRPRADLQQRHPSHDHLHHQSRMIIQRQREVIERQLKTAPKPPPRQVQMEPTENPTVIDPDAFDRSYVVQHPTASQTTSNGRANSGTRGGRRRSPKGKETPKQVSKKLSENPNGDADVDYVLKSGQPRGSTKGKGRLWVP